MPEPQNRYQYAPWMTRGRTRTGAPVLPPPEPPSRARYYLPTITRGAQQPAARHWSGIATTAQVSPNPFATSYAPPTYAPLTQAPTAAPTHIPVQAPVQAPATAPHALVQMWDLAQQRVAQVKDMGQLAEEIGRQYAPPEVAADTGGAGGVGGGGYGGGGAPPPAGVDAYWYAEFQRQHNGQTPEQFYAQTGEGLAEAMADEEWARGFAEMYGRPPNDYDWRAHWFSTRVGYTPEEYQKWKEEQVNQRLRDLEQQLRQQQKQLQEPEPAPGPEPEEQPEQRPPVYQPPFITWR